MKTRRRRFRYVLAFLSAFALTTAFAAPSAVGQTVEDLARRIDQMERELQKLKSELGKAQEESEEAKQEAQAAKQQAQTARKEATARDYAYSKWHLSGYADAGFTATDSRDTVETFTAGHFNPNFHWQYKDLLLFESELQFEVDDEGETEIDLEYAQLNLMMHDYATFAIGKYLSPVGQFQERLHPSWINKLPDAPAGFGHGGIQPLSDVGIQFRGGVPFGPVTGTYALFLGNGPRVGHHGVELEGFGSDDNDNKAIGGRIGLLPLPYFEVGGSFMTAKVRGEEADSGPVTEGRFTLWGADFSYTRKYWDVRGEYLNAELDSFFGSPSHGADETELIPTTDWQAWYIQVAYQLAGLTDIPLLRNLEPVIRYGEFEADGFGEFEEDNEDRFNVGLNYLLSPTLIAKSSVELRNFRDEGTVDDTRFLLQLAYGF